MSRWRSILVVLLPLLHVQSVNGQDTTLDKIQADTVYARLMRGESFATLALLYSQDLATMQQGGEYKEFFKGKNLDKVFWANIKDLPVGEISKPIKTQFGWHIVQIIERQGNKVRFRHILLNAPR